MTMQLLRLGKESARRIVTARPATENAMSTAFAQLTFRKARDSLRQGMLPPCTSITIYSRRPAVLRQLHLAAGRLAGLRSAPWRLFLANSRLQRYLHGRFGGVVLIWIFEIGVRPALVSTSWA